ncbi:MAG: DUF503 domain-containing protein [Acidimicrobiia bacterium]
MPAAALTVELHLPDVHSLKEKRAVIRPIIEGAQHRFRVAAAEIELQDLRQRTVLGFAAVASTVGHVGAVLDEVERFVWSFPEIDVLEAGRAWMEET